MRLLIIILYFLYITEILKVTLHDKTDINCKHLRLLPLWKLKRVFFRRMLRKTYDFLWYPILEFGSVIALVAYLPKKTKTYESLGESRQFLHIQ